MKKDIKIPEVKDVFLAISQEYNEAFKTDDHYVYLINKKDVDLEMVLIVSKGEDGSKQSRQILYLLSWQMIQTLHCPFCQRHQRSTNG